MYKLSIGNIIKGRRLFLSASLILLLSITLLLSSCSSSSKSENIVAPQGPQAGYGGEMADKQEAPMPAPSAAPSQSALGGDKGKTESGQTDGSTSVDLENERKLIMDGNVQLETLDFDSSIKEMDQLIKDFKGFAETRTVRGKSDHSRALRTANYIIRVPAESFDAVLKNMGSVGTVLESNSQGTDITDRYYDSQTRVKSLKIQEQTLLDILAKAEKLEDVITLESRLAEIRYEVESIENTLKNYDRLVSFSRITVYIQEVDEITETPPVEKKLSERISSAFTRSLKDFRISFENFLVWFVGSFISLLFVAAVIIILWLLLRRRSRKVTEYQKYRQQVGTEDSEDKEKKDN